jgi:cytidine deaminase
MASPARTVVVTALYPHIEVTVGTAVYPWIMLRNLDLVDIAQAKINPHRVGDRLFGDVAAALETTTGAVHTGVCIDTGSGTGFCAEHAAIASMVNSGEYEIARIVAVWRDDHGRLTVLAPCGRCREFIRQVDPFNLATTIVLGQGKTVPLHALLPEWEWPQPENTAFPPASTS